MEKAVNTLRALSIDAIDAANSGHPGLPLGVAPMAYVLFKNHLRFNPKDPHWAYRDRFILSAGHGSALLYSLLHLFGYEVSLDDLKGFRQLGSPTAGHPEYGHLPGVEITTGPLGQGIASSVGFAIAAAKAKADNYTYVICGDGDLMEGVSSESSSLAARLGLNKLIVLYDDNNITIDGKADLAWKEDIPGRYKAYGWDVFHVEDGNDMVAIDKAISEAKASPNPAMIQIKTVIGYGSQKVAGTSAAHGAPLGKDESQEVKKAFGLDPEKTFFVDKDVQEHFDAIVKEKIKDAEQNYEINEITFSDELFDELVAKDEAPKATRIHSETVLQAMFKGIPELVGGSADLAASNKTKYKEEGYFSHDNPQARNIAFGIREHAMAAIVNGITLYGENRAFGATFLTFADYMKPAIRLAALMDIPSMFVFTHDSIGVGEDGPTHQPIEHLNMLRSIPNMRLYRPCDYRETVVSYQQMINGHGPSAIALTRQTLPENTFDRSDEKRGGYVIMKEEKDLELILMASGSEVGLALEVANEIKDKIGVRVVSMLCMEDFNAQDEAYREKVLPKAITKRYAIEAAHPMSWDRYLGLEGSGTFMRGFGASGNADDVFKHFGFSKEAVLADLKAYLSW